MTSIIDFLNELAAASEASAGHISFHMPGHKGRSSLYERTGYSRFLRNLMACDITEIPGADALFCPESTIKAVMDGYAELYGVKHSELLVNGSSAGVMAAVISSVPIGGKLILGRNSHHSAFSAMRLWGINPVYIRPEIDRECGLVSEISPSSLEQACRDNPDASAVLITSPNYYGILSDISALAAIAHEHDMILIVDQAHGAHLRFFDSDAEAIRAAGGYVTHTRHSAESLGADIVVNSTHKTLLSFTGSGILNICTDRPSVNAVSDTLRMLQTTSPSYLLMGSLDINLRIMSEYGSDIIRKWRSDLTDFYRRAGRIDGLDLITCPIEDDKTYAMYNNRTGLDMTKINISMARLGLSGEQLERELIYKGIIPEMVHGSYVMLMTGAGNVSSDYDALLTALKEISANYGVASGFTGSPLSEPGFDLDSADVPVEYEEVPLYMADGRVLYDPVIVYPPGTPVACPGEIMNAQVISFIAKAIENEDKVSGVDEEGMIRVGI
ncbi:MAG: hypothetical protein E7220_04280 [Clostridiales bacterium]|nr:hypothetical protein [Clostridiales bacterium]